MSYSLNGLYYIIFYTFFRYLWQHGKIHLSAKFAFFCLSPRTENNTVLKDLLNSEPTLSSETEFLKRNVLLVQPPSSSDRTCQKSNNLTELSNIMPGVSIHFINHTYMISRMRSLYFFKTTTGSEIYLVIITSKRERLTQYS